jgi:hypothetical protein
MPDRKSTTAKGSGRPDEAAADPLRAPEETAPETTGEGTPRGADESPRDPLTEPTPHDPDPLAAPPDPATDPLAAPDPDPLAPSAEAPAAEPHAEPHAGPHADTPPDLHPEADPRPEPATDWSAGSTTGSPAADPSADPAAFAAARQEPDLDAERDRGTGAPHDGSRDTAHDADDDEPAGRSFASLALVALLLLLVGAALGIWAAPRIAPHLPAGMAPVAAWMAPARPETETRLAALETDLDDGLGTLAARIEAVEAEAADTAAVDARVAEAESRLDARLEEVTAAFEALSGAEGGERLARLESALDGQAAALASLRDQLADVDGVEGVAAQVDVYEAELSGLRAEVRDLAGQVGGLSGRLEEVAADAERQVEIARQQVSEIEAETVRTIGEAERQNALAQIRSALAAGAPYDEALARLEEDEAVAVPAGLADPAESGVATLATLRDRFPDAAHDAIRANIMARAGDGVIERARAFAEAQMASRSLTPQPGVDPDAVLSRMEEALRRDDLEAALAEAESLPSEAAAAMEPWLAAARARAAAVADHRALEAELSAMN